MFFEIVSDMFSLMCFGVVDEEQVLFPASSEKFKKFDKLSCSLSLFECEDKSLFTASAEDICILVGVIDRHYRMATSSCPSALDDGNESECRFILCAHNKPFPSEIPCFPSSFFLNCSITSSLGRL